MMAAFLSKSNQLAQNKPEEEDEKQTDPGPVEE
jgi:hypothetical protein